MPFLTFVYYAIIPQEISTTPSKSIPRVQHRVIFRTNAVLNFNCRVFENSPIYQHLSTLMNIPNQMAAQTYSILADKSFPTCQGSNDTLQARKSDFSPKKIQPTFEFQKTCKLNFKSPFQCIPFILLDKKYFSS